MRHALLLGLVFTATAVAQPAPPPSGAEFQIHEPEIKPFGLIPKIEGFLAISGPPNRNYTIKLIVKTYTLGEPTPPWAVLDEEAVSSGQTGLCGIYETIDSDPELEGDAPGTAFTLGWECRIVVYDGIHTRESPSVFIWKEE